MVYDCDYQFIAAGVIDQNETVSRIYRTLEFRENKFVLLLAQHIDKGGGIHRSGILG